MIKDYLNPVIPTSIPYKPLLSKGFFYFYADFMFFFLTQKAL